MRKKIGMLFWIFSAMACLRTTPLWGCVAASSTTFSNISATGMTVDWASFCSTSTVEYSQVDDDPAFLSPFTLSGLGPPAVFGSTSALVPNTIYYARVSTSSLMLGSVALGSTRTLANVPGVLALSVNSSTQLQSDWTANGNPWGTVYEAEISSNGFVSVLSSSSTIGTTAVWNGLQPNVSYSLHVRALNGDGVGTVFQSLGSTSTFAEIPGVPSIPFSNISVQGFRIDWTSGTARWNPPDTLYEAQISTRVDFLGGVLYQSTTANHADFNGLSEGTVYFAQVRALNHDGAATAFVSLGSTLTSITPTPFNQAGSSATIESSNGAVMASVPAGSLSQDYQLFLTTDPVESPLGRPEIPVQISEAETKMSESGSPARLPLPGNMAEIRARDAQGHPLEISSGTRLAVTMSYPSSDGETVDLGMGFPVRAKTLQVYRLNESNSLWVRLPTSQVDTASRKVTTAAPGFGVFALVGQLDTSLETAFAYPVPFKANRGDRTITFSDLAQRATIRIFSVSGRWLRTLEETDGDGNFVWDVTDSDGNPLPSGVYFFLMESSADRKRGKLVVIR